MVWHGLTIARYLEGITNHNRIYGDLIMGYNQQHMIWVCLNIGNVPPSYGQRIAGKSWKIMINHHMLGRHSICSDNQLFAFPWYFSRCNPVNGPNNCPRTAAAHTWGRNPNEVPPKAQRVKYLPVYRKNINRHHRPIIQPSSNTVPQMRGCRH